MIAAIRVVAGEGAADSLAKAPQGGSSLRTVFESKTLIIEASAEISLRSSADGHVIVCGELLGMHTTNGEFVSPEIGLSRLLTSPARQTIVDSMEGRFAILLVNTDGRCEIWNDRFGGRDLYYGTFEDATWISSSLDLLPLSDSKPDPLSIAYTLAVYGCRPPKQHTLYSGVRRLGVDQSMAIENGRLNLTERNFVPVRTSSYGDRELHEYADLMLEAVRMRGSTTGNVVYLSSGWDSTAILGCLVHLFGARKVRAVIGRMRYAERSGVINQFELDRAQAVASFYGVRLDVVELDYRTGAAAILDKVRTLFQSQQFASLTGFNHWLLAEYSSESSGGDEVVFAGEMSDGAHNLGFSQFVSIFHPVLEFREYSDKMMSYLFGPTFLAMLQKGIHEQDLIYSLFRGRAGSAVFDDPAGGHPSSRTRQLLSSFFLRANRLPLISMRNTKLLTDSGREAFASEFEGTYLDKPAREAGPETLYSWYLHLYNSFHWQGSTVATLPLTAEANGLRCALPYHDGALQDFLSGMPESWGRGLDLKPTKYPLKWMLANRIKYPMHLQVGPHSYLYDVDPSFSHSAEILYGSSFRSVFKEALRSKTWQAWMTPDIFSVDYIRAITEGYLSGTEVRGAEMNDLLSLCVLTSIGRYSG